MGKGAYIVGSDESSEFSYLLSFTETMRRKSREVTNAVLEAEIVAAGIELGGGLGVTADKSLRRLSLPVWAEIS